jgi:signal transduction histidine kinase
MIVNGEDLPRLLPRGPVTLPAGIRSLAFEFGAGSFVAPGNVAICYQLVGIDREPRLADADRRATYGRLSPGDYTLRVSAANNDGVWSTSERILGITVQPFYYETAWFRILCVIAAIALVTVLGYRIARARYRRRTEALRREAAVLAERTRIARDMHDQLGASLTRILLLSDLAQSENHGPHLPKLAATAHEAVTYLDEIVWAVNPRHDTLASLVEYIGQQTTDLVSAAGLRCRLKLPATTESRHLSADFRHHLFLIVREAVNNATRHARAKEVLLTIEPGAAELRITITDDGIGFSENGALGNGLANMRSRAAELGGECAIAGAPGAGTTITVRLPWPQEKSANHKP